MIWVFIFFTVLFAGLFFLSGVLFEKQRQTMRLQAEVSARQKAILASQEETRAKQEAVRASIAARRGGA